MGNNIAEEHPLLNIEFRIGVVKTLHHMLVAGNGIDLEYINTILSEVITTELEFNNRVDCQVFKEYIYYKHFNLLYDDEFAIAQGHVAFHASRKLGISYNVDAAIELYTSLSINEVFGIDLLVFMKLPNDELTLLLEHAQKVGKVKANTMDEITKNFQ